MAECPNYKIANEFLKKHDWPASLCDNRHDKCYCSKCYPSELRDTYTVGGNTYVVPRGFTRIGLRVDEGHAEHQQIWEKWMNCFHGTSIENARSIVVHRMFLLPGDTKMEGSKIKIRDGHIPKQKYCFTSPSIAYASKSCYASSYEFKSPSDKNYYNIRVVLQCKQKPGTFIQQAETIGAGSTRICKFIKNDAIEWKTDGRNVVTAYGMLLQIEQIGKAVGSRMASLSRRTSIDLTKLKFAPPAQKEMEWKQVKCPHCYTPKDWINPDSNQGIVLICDARSCKEKFKVFNCPHCSDLNIICECCVAFDDETVFDCSKCRGELCSSKCPHCTNGYNYSKMPPVGQAIPITCADKKCKAKKYQFVACPHCDEFKEVKTVVGKEGVVVTCSDEDCLKKFQLALCTACSNVNVCPNAYTKVGRSDIVKCAFEKCRKPFKQPLQPRIKPVGVEASKSPSQPRIKPVGVEASKSPLQPRIKPVGVEASKSPYLAHQVKPTPRPREMTAGKFSHRVRPFTSLLEAFALGERPLTPLGSHLLGEMPLPFLLPPVTRRLP